MCVHMCVCVCLSLSLLHTHTLVLFMQASPPREEINRLYEAGPPSHASLDGEFGYESISYNDADGMKRLSMKVSA